MKNKKSPRVLVGCPTADYKKYCLDKYIEGVKNLTYDNYEVIIVDNSKDESYKELIEKEGIKVIKDRWTEWARGRIVSSRNKLREEFLKGKYDYLLLLSQDVIPPKDIIEKLIKHKKDIVTAVYYSYVFLPLTKKKKIIPRVFKIKTQDTTDKTTNYTLVPMIKESSGNELLEIDACGLGCCLVSRAIMETISFRYKKDTKDFDDLPFCFDAKKSGFEIYADMNVKCMHYIEGWDWGKLKI